MTATTMFVRPGKLSESFPRAIMHWESVLFATICTLDMLSTLYFVHHGFAYEANPLMARSLRGGDVSFCAVKLLSFVPLLIVAGWYRIQHPQFVSTALRIGIAIYVGVYVISVGGQLVKL